MHSETTIYSKLETFHQRYRWSVVPLNITDAHKNEKLCALFENSLFRTHLFPKGYANWREKEVKTGIMAACQDL